MYNKLVCDGLTTFCLIGLLEWKFMEKAFNSGEQWQTK
jgi:hypothetical protein